MKIIYKPIITFLILLHILLFTSLTCFSQDEEREKGTMKSKKISSLQKSLLIPGWGQIAEKRYLEGALFLSAEIFCIYKIFSNNHKSNYYYNRYKTADNTTDAVNYRDLTEKYDIRRNKFLLAAAGIWIINLIDIYIDTVENEKTRTAYKLRLDHFFNFINKNPDKYIEEKPSRNKPTLNIVLVVIIVVIIIAIIILVKITSIIVKNRRRFSKYEYKPSSDDKVLEKIKYDIIHGKTMDFMHLSKTDLEDLLDRLYQEDEVSDETLAYLENIISDYDKNIKYKKDNFKD